MFSLIQYEKKYNQVNASFYSCQYIVCFCTKYKRKIINDEIKNDLIKIFKEISIEYNFDIIDLNIESNYIILQIDCNPNFGIYKAVTKLKNISAAKIKEKHSFLKKRIPSIWTREEFISTIGNITINNINDFIDKQ